MAFALGYKSERRLRSALSGFKIRLRYIWQKRSLHRYYSGQNNPRDRYGNLRLRRVTTRGSTDLTFDCSKNVTPIPLCLITPTIICRCNHTEGTRLDNSLCVLFVLILGIKLTWEGAELIGWSSITGRGKACIKSCRPCFRRGHKSITSTARLWDLQTCWLSLFAD